MIDDIELSELLAVKIFHDLSGPVGAVNNGVELLKDSGEDFFDQSVDLIEASATEAVSRILLYRLAYGAINADQMTDISSLKELTKNFFAQKPITLNWQAAASENIKTVTAKTIINLILLTVDTLIHGGEISISIGKNKVIKVRGEGKNIKVKSEITGTLNKKKNDNIEINIKNIHAYLIRKILQKQKIKPEIKYSDNFFEITVS